MHMRYSEGAGEYGMTFTGDWKKFEKLFTPGVFQRNLQKNINIVTQRASLYVSGKIRDRMKSGQYISNKPLTIAIKGSSKPLIGLTSTLWKSITGKRISWDKGIAGVLRTDGKLNIAKMIHNGGTIRVTPKMVNMFKLLSRYTQNMFKGNYVLPALRGRAAALWALNQVWYSINKAAISIPSRPFIRKTWDDERIRSYVRSLYARGVNQALRDSAS